MRFVQSFEKAFVSEALGSHEQEFQFLVIQLVVNGADLSGVERGIEACGRDVVGEERIDLVPHEGDERRDDEGESIEDE